MSADLQSIASCLSILAGVAGNKNILISAQGSIVHRLLELE